MNKLEEVLKPGNIVKVCSTVIGHREQWGVILDNGEVMYTDHIGGFDRLTEFNPESAEGNVWSVYTVKLNILER